jgi:hypothetical protein
VAGAHEQDTAAVELPEHLLDERRRGSRDRCRALRDRRLRADLLPGVQRLTEEAIEHRPGRARLECRADLTEDLALARNERVQAGGDAEEVQGGGLVREAVDDRAQLIRRQSADGHERVERTDVRLRADEVELGAVAGREADGLSAFRQGRRQLGCLRQRDEGPLADGDRRALVREPYEGERHEK